jgi:hypothetical protein
MIQIAREDADTVWNNDPSGQQFREMPFDSANGILYSANITAGLWALKVR